MNSNLLRFSCKSFGNYIWNIKVEDTLGDSEEDETLEHPKALSVSLNSRSYLSSCILSEDTSFRGLKTQ